MVIKREHTAANVAPAITKLCSQMNAAYPKRDKASDGIWPSAAHSKASPNSDHEAGNATDFDDDLSGVDGKAPMVTPELAAQLSRDPRCNYTIHDAIIYHDGVGRPYTGSNKHVGHIHVSVWESKRNDASAWKITTRPVFRCIRKHGARHLPRWKLNPVADFLPGHRYICYGSTKRWLWLRVTDYKGRSRMAWGSRALFVAVGR